MLSQQLAVQLLYSLGLSLSLSKTKQKNACITEHVEKHKHTVHSAMEDTTRNKCNQGKPNKNLVNKEIDYYKFKNL